MRTFALIVAVAVAATRLSAAAQNPDVADDRVAQFYSYRVTDQTKFEAGYREHLGWHARNDDPLVWYAWTVETGPRRGLFVDGTAGASFAALDGRVKPDEDGADFRRTAAPHAEAIDVETWALWRQPSIATPLEDRKPSAIIDIFTVEVTPRDVQAFERAMVALGAARGDDGSVRLSWYRRLRGGDGPVYLAMLARDDWTDLGAAGGTFPEMLQRAYGASPEAAGRLLDRIASIGVETWRYEPRLSLMPGSALAP